MTVTYKWGLGYSHFLSGVTEIPVAPMYEEGLGCTEVTSSGEPRLNLPEKLPLREEQMRGGTWQLGPHLLLEDNEL